MTGRAILTGLACLAGFSRGVEVVAALGRTDLCLFVCCDVALQADLHRTGQVDGRKAGEPVGGHRETEEQRHHKAQNAGHDRLSQHRELHCRSPTPGMPKTDVPSSRLRAVNNNIVRCLHTIAWLPEFNVVVFAALLNFPWEFLQVPLYEGMPNAPHWEAVKTCTRAALGDVLIMLAAYWAVAAFARNRRWILAPSGPQVALFIAAGVLVTTAIEWLALHGHWIASWRYSEHMPIVPGIGVGLSPLLQWIVLPPLVVWFVQRQLLPARSRC